MLSFDAAGDDDGVDAVGDDDGVDTAADDARDAVAVINLHGVVSNDDNAADDINGDTADDWHWPWH